MTTNTPDFFLPSDLVAGALDSILQDIKHQLDLLGKQPKQGNPDIKEETTFYLKQYRAFTKAAYHWALGVRPTPTASSGWLIPSASRPGSVVHEVSKQGGIWACGPSCEAGQRGIFHWHTALIGGIERAMELAELDGDDAFEPYDAYEDFQPAIEVDDAPFLPDAPAVLGRRLAAVRAQYMQAA